MADFIYGSICLSDIPKRLFKRVMCKDGVERVYLNVKIVRRNQVSQYGDTHFISCEPKDKNDRVEGEKYIIGDLKEYAPKDEQPAQQTAQPQQATDLNLPF